MDTTIDRTLTAVIGGALTGVAVLTGAWPVAILGLAAVTGATSALDPMRRVLIGTAAGGVHATVTTLWVLPFTLAGTIALILLQASGWGLATLAASRRARWPWPLAPAFAISEWARAYWPLGGYPPRAAVAHAGRRTVHGHRASPRPLRDHGRHRARSDRCRSCPSGPAQRDARARTVADHHRGRPSAAGPATGCDGRGCRRTGR